MGLRLPSALGRPRSAVASRPAGARAKPAKPGRRAIARRTLAAAAGDAARSFASSLQNRHGWFSSVLFAHSDVGPALVFVSVVPSYCARSRLHGPFRSSVFVPLCAFGGKGGACLLSDGGFA